MPHNSDPFLLQLLVIFVWAKIFGELFEQMRLPAVLGEILAGIILGPFATGFVVPGPSVLSISELGAIFLLFSVGLETPPQELINVGRTSAGVALAGVVVPFALGFSYIILRGDPAKEATFIATAMVATSVGITARVLGDLQVLHTRAAKIILAAAVFDDILGMVLLAVVAGLAAATGVAWIQLGVLFAEAVSFALFMIFFAPRVIHRMSGRIKYMSMRDAPLVLALAICLGLSVAAQKIGMAAIVGAFFAGIAFAEYAPEWELRPRVGAITEFLTPFFFFTMGAQLNLSAFSRQTLTVAIVISILAILSKVIGCGLPMLREGWSTALKVGVGMTPRGEVGLIVALIGLNAKMITESGYAVVIIMIVVTTLFAPPILRILFHKETGVAEAQTTAAGE
ncbi:MAG: transporter, family [Candidatus Angelobacter sp.]|nr:transporter, family [Candidatus Angelobacter sp.]